MGRRLEGTCGWSQLAVLQLSCKTDKDCEGTPCRASRLLGLLCFSPLNPKKARHPVITISSFSTSLQAAVDYTGDKHQLPPKNIQEASAAECQGKWVGAPFTPAHLPSQVSRRGTALPRSCMDPAGSSQMARLLLPVEKV